MSDLDDINHYNNANRHPDLKLQTQLGQCFAEGNPETCSILILLGNPLFNPESKPSDHTLSYEGWPLAGVHEDAPKWLNQWWRRRLRHVASVARDDWQLVSRKVAAININPWASEKFDENCRLPSRAGQIERAQKAAKRGALLIVARARKAWLPHLPEHNVILTRSPRCSYISPKNLGVTWARVENEMMDRNHQDGVAPRI